MEDATFVWRRWQIWQCWWYWPKWRLICNILVHEASATLSWQLGWSWWSDAAMLCRKRDSFSHLHLYLVQRTCNCHTWATVFFWVECTDSEAFHSTQNIFHIPQLLKVNLTMVNICKPLTVHGQPLQTTDYELLKTCQTLTTINLCKPLYMTMVNHCWQQSLTNSLWSVTADSIIVSNYGHFLLTAATDYDQSLLTAVSLTSYYMVDLCWQQSRLWYIPTDSCSHWLWSFTADSKHWLWCSHCWQQSCKQQSVTVTTEECVVSWKIRCGARGKC